MTLSSARKKPSPALIVLGTRNIRRKRWRPVRTVDDHREAGSIIARRLEEGRWWKKEAEV